MLPEDCNTLSLTLLFNKSKALLSNTAELLPHTRLNYSYKALAQQKNDAK